VKRQQIAYKLARQERLSSAKARDEVDELVHKILKRLEKGQPVHLPGLGKLVAKASRPKTR